MRRSPKIRQNLDAEPPKDFTDIVIEEDEFMEEEEEIGRAHV